MRGDGEIVKSEWEWEWERERSVGGTTWTVVATAMRDCFQRFARARRFAQLCQNSMRDGAVDHIRATSWGVRSSFPIVLGATGMHPFELRQVGAEPLSLACLSIGLI
jgi:hypothetical protein